MSVSDSPVRLVANTYRIGEALAVLRELPPGAFHTCVTSPPYWGLRDYGHPGQLGLESTPEEYVERLVAIFREVRRVLRDDGTLWLNLGDSYSAGKQGRSDADRDIGGRGGNRLGSGNPGNAKVRTPPPGLKPKDLVGIPWRVAFALQADGWYLRSDIIWSKPNPMPESVTDRPTKAHEYLFLLSKRERYYYDADAVREPHQDKQGVDRFESSGGNSANYDPATQGWVSGAGGFSMKPGGRDYNPLGRNKRSVWTVATQPYPGAHFAVFPPALIKPCILAGCPVGGTVLDTFFGSGTTGMVAESLGRCWFGIELNPEYEPQIRKRTAQVGLL